ncbi:hypothetical protein ACI2K4_19960 [Micromonospora sp. NPDC050397]|uniref:hypothetical protein n=1 Tax=Micromonospora sp. NPDC050397 TaxID=3364279 RepID=UPI00384EDE9C
MATKSSVRHRPESRIALVVILAALLGGATAGCAAAEEQRGGPSVSPTSLPPAPRLARGTALPSYPLSDRIPPPSPGEWSLPLPPSAETSRPGTDQDALPWTPDPPAASGGASSTVGGSGGSGGAGGAVTDSGGKRAVADREGAQRPEGYQLSLIYSGLLGMTISAIGIAMIGRRRQLW